jgi:hypothetical protein
MEPYIILSYTRTA